MIDEEDNSNPKYFPIVEEVKEGSSHADNRDGQQNKGRPILFDGKERDEMQNNIINILNKHTKSYDINSKRYLTVNTIKLH